MPPDTSGRGFIEHVNVIDISVPPDTSGRGFIAHVCDKNCFLLVSYDVLQIRFVMPSFLAFFCKFNRPQTLHGLPTDQTHILIACWMHVRHVKFRISVPPDYWQGIHCACKCCRRTKYWTLINWTVCPLMNTYQQRLNIYKY